MNSKGTLTKPRKNEKRVKAKVRFIYSWLDGSVTQSTHERSVVTRENGEMFVWRAGAWWQCGMEDGEYVCYVITNSLQDGTK